MAAAMVLLAYTMALGQVVPLALDRKGWTPRAPRLAIKTWQTLSASWLLSVVLAGLTMAAPWLWYRLHVGVRPGLAALASAPFLPRPAAALVGGALACGIALRSGWVVAWQLIRTHEQHLSHGAGLALIGGFRSELGAVVIDHDVPAAYCIPNPDPRRSIVITTAALRVLNSAQLQAVLEHERTHLRERHHVITVIAEGLARAVPGVQLFHRANEQIALLTEMAADDSACRRHGRAVTADALVNLARARVAPPALGAAGVAVARRARRILAPDPPLSRLARMAVGAMAIGALALPLLAACGVLILVAVLLARIFGV